MNYKVQYKSEEPFEIELMDGALSVNGSVQNLDILKINESKFHIIKDNKSYDISVVSMDRKTKQCTISVNGKNYELKLSNELDQLLLKMGMGKSKDNKMDVVKAPMPGLVLHILVEIAQSIEKGDSLIILEAMKMENIIKATGSGIVKAIKVSTKDAVEKNQVLIEME
ncbi:MAG: acetyl-CoA carboxylase biotin carboxyl carrier protein subunit [Bacteroidetes bacterium]|nr:acetyl-CoA carboxylase biotin carboxyl carrier protein subunit [Bacteroidota bacterium]MBK7639319.1 acetyl-CoA carboxylase biotin carboxyl carrier protein subunit [Bacteroidota bacterium]